MYPPGLSLDFFQTPFHMSQYKLLGRQQLEHWRKRKREGRERRTQLVDFSEEDDKSCILSSWKGSGLAVLGPGAPPWHH